MMFQPEELEEIVKLLRKVESHQDFSKMNARATVIGGKLDKTYYALACFISTDEHTTDMICQLLVEFFEKLRELTE